MTDKTDNNLLRLWKRHTPEVPNEATAADGAKLVGAQSIRNATMAALIAILVFSMLWAALSDLTNRVLPWMTMVLGIPLGIAIRRAGRGVDWRFPVLAAVAACIGALVANIVVAAALKAAELDVSTLQILGAVTTLTWPDFFSEVVTPADAVYALFAAGIAAFYASPRLTRQQYFALRLWQQEQERE